MRLTGFEHTNNNSRADLSIDAPYIGVITSTYEKGIAIHPESDKDSDVLARVPYRESFPIYNIDQESGYGYIVCDGIAGFFVLIKQRK